MANVILNDIRKIYPGGVTAVREFNLEIMDKEFIVLVGPSGCGKSTVLRMIAGLEEITEGELSIGGRRMNDVPPKARDIAMVFQNYALYPHMTVFQNMAFALKLRKTPKPETEERVSGAARILGIEQLLQRKPKALSGGERQRVALGRAMVRSPAAFLLDEPLSNLDAKLRAAMRTELIKLHQRLQATFIYVTHDQTEAMTMGDRIVIMRDGLIQQVAPPQKLYDEPCNMFVAGFIGSPQMNFIQGGLVEEGGEYFVLLHGDRFRISSVQAADEAASCNAGSGGLAEYAGKPVIAGIRPENLHADDAFLANNPGNIISALVDVSEQMGSEIYLYLDYNGDRLTARVPPGGVYRPGDQVRIGLDASKLRLFDLETEEAIISCIL